MSQPMTTEQRFWAKVNLVGPIPDHAPYLGHCQLWTAARNHNGYGTFQYEGQSRLAHRVAYQLTKGRIPEGLQIDHLCRVRTCVNPAHLEAVPQRINILRGEGVAAKAAAVTHCPYGHPYDAANTYVVPAGNRRDCRACRKQRDAIRHKRERAKNR